MSAAQQVVQQARSLIGRQLVSKCFDGAFRKVTIVDPNSDNTPTGANATAVISGQTIFGLLTWDEQVRMFTRL